MHVDMGGTGAKLQAFHKAIANVSIKNFMSVMTSSFIPHTRTIMNISGNGEVGCDAPLIYLLK